ncbi:MAG: metallopeptidase TldD-related protein [Acidimicrobiales bacterium]
MSADARTHFEAVHDDAVAALQGDEVLLVNISGETSDFVRFNHAAIRQAGSVRQAQLTCDLILGRRHAEGSLTLSGDLATDRGRVRSLLAELREIRSAVPDDPHLLYATELDGSERRVEGDALDAPDAIDAVLDGVAGKDLVGIYAAGETYRGFANSLGQRNWFSATTFNVDWSLYHQGDKATKSGYAGTHWDPTTLSTKLDRSVAELDALSRPVHPLPPGDHRTFLAPAALNEIVDLIAWGGFGLRSHETTQTPFLRMITDGVELHPTVSIAEDVGGGVSPDFQGGGFRRPGRVPLIDRGRYVGHLISPRSAMEYDVDTNGAEDEEYPVAISVAGGDLPMGNALAALGEGLYVGNLWYLNYSDRAGCRTTGMTRFGTFWVEGGEIVAPIDVLRFDDTVYSMLGDNLEALTSEVDTILDPSTYDQRSTDSSRLPGALLSQMRYTL